MIATFVGEFIVRIFRTVSKSVDEKCAVTSSSFIDWLFSDR